MSLTLHTEVDDLTSEVADAFDEAGILESGNSSSEGDAEPVAETGEPKPETAESKHEVDRDEEDFRVRVWNAEMRCRGKEAIVEDLKEQLKLAKAEYDESVSALRKLARDGNQPMLFPSTPRHEPKAEEFEPLDLEPAPDESWKDRDFNQWLDSMEIEGLGDTKREALREVVDVFFDFECLRVEAQKQGCHLSHLLPSGFGVKITDRIEEAFLRAKDELEETAIVDKSEEPDTDLDSL